MAKIYPQEVRGKSKAEQIFLEYLRLCPRTWRVYFGWDLFLKKKKKHEEKFMEAEADAIVVVPELGYLVIEIKGGQAIRYREGTWYSVDHNGEENLIKNPIQQARTIEHELRKELCHFLNVKELPFIYTHAVAFPQCDEIESQQIEPHYINSTPRHKFITHHVLRKGHLRHRIIEILKSSYNQPESKRHMKEKEIEAIDKIIHRDMEYMERLVFQIDFAKLHGVQSVTAGRYIKLSENQKEKLRRIKASNRVRVEGCAGSGKTLFAVHLAKEYSRKGSKVLLTCYNRKIGSVLKEINYESRNIVVDHFHGLMKNWLSRFGLWKKQEEKLLTIEKDPQRTEHFWNKEIPEVFFNKCAPELTDKKGYFDVIIVDEGQDFFVHWFDILECMLSSDKEKSRFVIFYDPYQNVYKRRKPVPEDFTLVPLFDNWRTPQEIFKFLREKFKDLEYVEAQGPIGGKYKYNKYSNPLVGLKTLIRDLIRKENVNPEQIAILSPYKLQHSLLRGNSYIAEYELHEKALPEKNKIRFSTIKSFKGLESEVIIVIDITEKWIEKSSEDLYVALTRPLVAVYFILRSGLLRVDTNSFDSIPF